MTANHTILVALGILVTATMFGLFLASNHFELAPSLSQNQFKSNHTSPAALNKSKPRHPDVNDIPLAIALKTGKETVERAETLLETSLKGFKQVTIISDHSGKLKGLPIIDVYTGLYNKYGTRELFQTGEGWQRDSHKFLPGLRALYENYPNSLWYMIIDDDTSVFLHSLGEHIKQYNSSDAHYMGLRNTHPNGSDGCLEHDDTSHVFGGSGILISRGAVQKILPHLDTCIPKYRTCKYGDVSLGLCFHDIGVKMEQVAGFHPDNFDKKNLHNALRLATSFANLPSCGAPRAFHKLSFDVQRTLSELAEETEDGLITYGDIYRYFFVNQYTRLLALPQQNVDINANSFANIPKATEYECMDACVEDPKCVSYVFDDKNVCWLKEWPGRMDKSPGKFGGILGDKYQCLKNGT